MLVHMKGVDNTTQVRSYRNRTLIFSLGWNSGESHSRKRLDYKTRSSVTAPWVSRSSKDVLLFVNIFPFRH